MKEKVLLIPVSGEFMFKNGQMERLIHAISSKNIPSKLSPQHKALKSELEPTPDPRLQMPCVHGHWNHYITGTIALHYIFSIYINTHNYIYILQYYGTNHHNNFVSITLRVSRPRLESWQPYSELYCATLYSWWLLKSGAQLESGPSAASGTSGEWTTLSENHKLLNTTVPLLLMLPGLVLSYCEVQHLRVI